MHHCKCDDCRELARNYEFWRQAQIRRGKALLVPALGTQRRIQALQRLGYSQSIIGAECGRSAPWVTHLTRVTTVKPATAQLIDALYARLSMTPPNPQTKHERAGVTKAKRYAKRMGWAGPLDWDDIDLDPEPPTVERDTDRGGWVVEEMDFLKRSGESAESIAVTLKRTRDGMARLAYRHGRPELARWMEDRAAA